MKFNTPLLALLPLAVAFPLESLFAKRADLTLDTQNDLLNGTPCKKITGKLKTSDLVFPVLAI